MGAGANLDIAGKDSTRGNVGMCGDVPVVIDRSARIDECIICKNNTSLQHCASHHLRTSAQFGFAGDERSRMNEWREREPGFALSAVDIGAKSGIIRRSDAHSTIHRHWIHLFQGTVAAKVFEIAQFSVRGRVGKAHNVSSESAERAEDHASVTPTTENHERAIRCCSGHCTISPGS